MTAFANFWRGKRVLITGHTGFKGGWLALWLQQLGADVTGIALVPNTDPNLFELAHIQMGVRSLFCDIRDEMKLAQIIRATQPQVILHLAAQPLVRIGYIDPLVTYSTNVMGTANLLDAMRGLECLKVAIIITTDKVYCNNGLYYPYRESDPLGGHDPYSASKAASEIVISSYRDAYLQGQGIAVASVRAGNVIGGGDWSKDRLIPDAVRAWQAGTALKIRRPHAIRPWQHVLEPLHGYLTLAHKLWESPNAAGAYNFGPHAQEATTVRQVIEEALRVFGRGDVIYEECKTGPHEADWLALETAKVRETLSLRPQWPLVETVRRTMDWYRAQQSGADARKLCLLDIADYEKAIGNIFI